MYFSTEKANLHSPRERQCLVSRYKRKCIPGWVEVRKVKNFKHTQEDSHIFSLGLNVFHTAAKLSGREITCEKSLLMAHPIHKILHVTGWFYVKLHLSNECSWANMHGFFQAVTSLCLSASVLPVTSKPCTHKGFHLILFHESLHIRAADAQNTAARTANGLSSPAINMYGLKFDRTVLKVSPSREARKEVWQEFSKRYEGTRGLCISVFKVSIKPSYRPEGTFLSTLQLPRCVAQRPQPRQTGVLSAEQFQCWSLSG